MIHVSEAGHAPESKVAHAGVGRPTTAFVDG